MKTVSFLHILSLICAAMVGMHPIVHGQGLVFNKITSNHGLSHNTVYTIAQDRKGFMWFGTREGLNRFDGNNILTFYADPADSTRLLSNHITSLSVGSDGMLYVGTGRGLHIYNDSLGNFRRVRSDVNTGDINCMITATNGSLFVCASNGLFVMRNGKRDLTQVMGGFVGIEMIEFKRGVFWVATLEKMLMINEHGEVLREYTGFRNNEGQVVKLNDNIFSLFKDSFGQFWMGTKKDGLFRYDQGKDTFLPVVMPHKSSPLEVNAVRTLAEDPKKRLWIGTESGLFLYDRTTNSFTHYNQSFDQSPDALSDKAIYIVFRSREGIMWIGTYFGGVNVVRPVEKGFKTLIPDGGIRKLSGKAISDIIEDKNGKLWIATEDGGVNIWNRSTNEMRYLKSEYGKTGLNVNNIHELYEDHNGMFWIGTFLGGVNRYDEKTGNITIYKRHQEETSAFTNNMIYAIRRDRNGDMLIGTTGGLHKFNQQRGTYEAFKPEIFGGLFIYEMYEDKAGDIWICVNNHDRVYRYEPATRQVTSYQNPEFVSTINRGFIAIHEDSEGQMWFGSINCGLLKLDRTSGKFQSYTINDGLPNNYVYGIQEDSKGDLWLSTNKGLSHFDVKSRKFTNYDISHGLPNNQFNYKSAFTDSKGWMYFGTVNGLSYFHPDSLMVNEQAPVPYLSDFKLFNKSIPIGEGSVLANSIDATREIELEYADNTITFEFGAINYYSSGKIRYGYYLENFDRDWNETEGNNSATYTNLSAGTYIFKVKAANNDGYWSDIKEVRLSVMPPFWQTKWAIALYAVFAVGLFLAYKQFLHYRHKEKMAIQLERIEKEKISELNQHKLNFFTYISHEFKTPLTLIIASIDRFLQEKQITEDHNNGFLSIKRSAKRLHALIDQLMEFRRVETDHARMNYAKGDIVLFLCDTFMAFSPLFNKNHIDSYFNSDTSVFNTYFDADKLEKIVTNLVSNAAKYTRTDGLIEMDVSIVRQQDRDHDLIRIVVSDTGVGMDAEELKNVFTVFYQTEVGKKSGSGTGIGLALVRGLVDFMNGKIDVQSMPNVGTQVTVELPLLRHVADNNISLVDGNRLIDIEHVMPLPRYGSKDSQQHASPEYQMLIVEDSEELTSFLGEHYEASFKLHKAENGVQALERIKRSAPDIIVSDVMMPEMDGIELCRAVKSDINTSHIPVVLLTARITMESRIEGLDVGADAYIAKPFALKELDLVIKNLLTTRERLRGHFLKTGSLNGIEKSFVNRDVDLMQKLTGIVEKNIENTDFNITMFAEEACVSRSLLHLKLKKLVGLSASEFIRHMRLQKAAEMLRTTALPISEVAYKVGYSDSNYFSRSFKEKYSVNPTDYKQGNA